MTEPLLCEISVPGRKGFQFAACDVPETPLPQDLVREDLPMPELYEVDVIRHFILLQSNLLRCSSRERFVV